MNNRATLSNYAAGLQQVEAGLIAPRDNRAHKADMAQRLADIEQQVKDGLITRKEGDRKIREINAE